MDGIRDKLAQIAAAETNPTVQARISTLADVLEVVEYRRFLDHLYIETLRVLNRVPHEISAAEALAELKNDPAYLDLVRDTLAARQAALARGTET